MLLSILFFCSCVEHLLHNNANPRLRDVNGYNTLHYAAANGHCLAAEKVNRVPVTSAQLGSPQKQLPLVILRYGRQNTITPLGLGKFVCIHPNQYCTPKMSTISQLYNYGTMVTTPCKACQSIGS